MKVFAKAPCSSANFGPGFDVYAIALDAYYDVVSLEGGVGNLYITGPYSSDIVYTQAFKIFDYLHDRFVEYFGVEREELDINLYKGVPVGLGLGSSASSFAALIKALDKYYGVASRDSDLVYLASLGEEYVAGSRHIDNVSASLLGGFVISSLDIDSLVIYPPEWLNIVLVIPNKAFGYGDGKTRFSRGLLKDCYDLGDCVFNIRRASYLIVGLLNSDKKLIRYGLSDVIAEPYRWSIVPFEREVFDRINDLDGVLGHYISGAGPSIAIVIDSDDPDVFSGIREIVDQYSLECELVKTSVSGGADVWVE